MLDDATWRLGLVLHDPASTIVLLGAVALVLSAGCSAAAAGVIRRMGVRQHVRLDGPETHLAKQGTPQMAGIGFGIAILLTAALSGLVVSQQCALVLGLMAVFGLIGFIDDYLKYAKQSPYGWNARYRLPAQVVCGALFVGLTQMAMPDAAGPHPFGAYLLAVLCVVGGANAVNFADGLDGLCAGLVAIVGAALAVCAAALGKAGDLVALGAIVAGAAAGFLWINGPPAQAFMGDVGSMTLGAALSGLAVAMRMEVLFGVLGFVFVIEALSVILQVASFQLTGRRIFRMAPFHHHLEKCGWPEQRIVVRAWLLTVAVALGAIACLIVDFRGPN
ncbi:MAG: phospho-N-acetylmuramoyl-pentapeptide-transferase [Armatimonadetes bacterium]|nr:phospho-N-acetylmuramoyl-pentapeptide-transferase [Armatimonadota bacterium]